MEAQGSFRRAVLVVLLVVIGYLLSPNACFSQQPVGIPYFGPIDPGNIVSIYVLVTSDDIDDTISVWVPPSDFILREIKGNGHIDLAEDGEPKFATVHGGDILFEIGLPFFGGSEIQMVPRSGIGPPVHMTFIGYLH